MNNAAFLAAFTATVGLEGDFSDEAADKGGSTRFGITEAVARAHGYQGDMRALPFDFAQIIYKAQYWDLLKLDDIAMVSTAIASELFDTGVNCGVGTAGKFLQRSLNAFNRQATDYPDVTVDGIVGPLTVSCLRSFIAKRGVDGQGVFLKALSGLKAERYIGIAEKDPTQEAFVYGWIKNRVFLG